MCQSCIDIDKQVEDCRELLRLTADPAETERISRLITRLYGDRVQLPKTRKGKAASVGGLSHYRRRPSKNAGPASARPAAMPFDLGKEKGPTGERGPEKDCATWLDYQGDRDAASERRPTPGRSIKNGTCCRG